MVENDVGMPAAIPGLRRLGSSSIFPRRDHVHSTSNDAITLDGILKTQFLRSDEADVMEASVAASLLILNNTHATGVIVDMQRDGTSRLKVAEDITIRLGDKVGVNKVEIQDSDGTVVAKFDSEGNLFIKGSVRKIT